MTDTEKIQKLKVDYQAKLDSVNKQVGDLSSEIANEPNKNRLRNLRDQRMQKLILAVAYLDFLAHLD